jgi:hypothetical protein
MIHVKMLHKSIMCFLEAMHMHGVALLSCVHVLACAILPPFRNDRLSFSLPEKQLWLNISYTNSILLFTEQNQYHH